MERVVKGKTVVITGGATGIGFQIADKFLFNDAKRVILLDLDKESGEKAVSNFINKYGNGKAAFIKCNVMTDLDTVFKQITDTYKTIDVLVNNAGWVRENSIRDTMELNTIAVVEWSMKFIETMGKHKGGVGGTIINMASIYGFFRGENSPFYATSKHAVMGFTKSMGHWRNYNKNGVRMIAICPGFTRTNLTSNGKFGDYESDATELLKNITWQEPDVVGDAAIEVFQKADTGTAWVKEGSNPVVPVP